MDIPYPGLARSAPIADFPVSLSEPPAHIRGPAPTLGADTNDVLCDLGFSTERIEEWRRSGII